MHACKVNPSSCYVFFSQTVRSKSKGRPFFLVMACKIQKQKTRTKAKAKILNNTERKTKTETNKNALISKAETVSP